MTDKKMTSEILDATKIVAKFDGAYTWFSPIHNGIFTEDLWVEYMISHQYPFKYHEKWDWLMPVIKKIEALHLTVNIATDVVEILSRGVEDEALPFMDTFMHIGEDIDEKEEDAKIKTAFRVVVKFVQWYNTQVK